MPQFYLRGFGHGNSIGVFNIERRQHIARGSIPGQCQRSYLYGRDGTNEAAIGKMEAGASPALRRITGSNRVPAVDSDDHFEIARFIAFQLTRTPKSARSRVTMEARIVDAAHAIVGPDTASTSTLRSCATEERELAATARRALSIIHAIVDLPMKLLTNRSALPFITSDSPVTRFNPWSHRWRYSGGQGLASRGLMISLPLNPSQLLLLADISVYSMGSSERIALRSHKDVIALNLLQALAAEQNLYYQNSQVAQNAIGQLPLHMRQEPLLGVKRLQSDEGEELLMTYAETRDPNIRLSFAPIRKELRGTALSERGHATRPVAMELERRLNPKPGADQFIPGQPKMFHVIEDL